jgi:hypothetical protein
MPNKMEEDSYVSPNLINSISNTSRVSTNQIINKIGSRYLNRINISSQSAIILNLTQRLEISFYLIVGLFIAIHAQ